MDIFVTARDQQEELDQYNMEVDHADSEIEVGNYVRHEDVEQFFQNRRGARQ